MKNRWPTRLARSTSAMAALLCAFGCGGNSAPPRLPATGVLSFVDSSNPATGISPANAVVADFRGDGKLDLAVPLFDGGVSVLLGSSNGAFSAAPPFPITGNDVNNAAVADFNGDGRPDLVVVLPYRNEVQVLLSNGDGTFAPMPPILIPDGVDFVATGDFNGDGKADIVTTLGGATNLTILLGNGDGTFAAAAASPAVEYEVWDVVVGDFNGDGISDLAVQNVEGSAQGWVTILLGNRNGTFTLSDNLPIDNPSSYMTVGDFNGDGILDLAGSTYVGGSCPSSGSVAVMLGNGDGTFTRTAESPSAGLCPSAIAVGDFNGDGIADLVALTDSGNMTVLLGNGDGTFAAPLSFAAGADHIGLAVGDFNGDGLTDVAVVENQTNSVEILLAHWTPTAAAK